jgi:hypothetical protein
VDSTHEPGRTRPDHPEPPRAGASQVRGLRRPAREGPELGPDRASVQDRVRARQEEATRWQTEASTWRTKAVSSQVQTLASNLLPPTITGPIFAKASEQSAVMSSPERCRCRLAPRPRSPSRWTSPGRVGLRGWRQARLPGRCRRQADDRQEGRPARPVSRTRSSRPTPAACYATPEDLPTAIARAFDQAAINGKDIRTGGAGPFSEYLAQTGSTVALGTAAQSTGGLYADIVNGVGKVVDKNYDFTGIAADPRFKVDALLQTDTQGRPLFNDANSADPNGGSLAGFPARSRRASRASTGAPVTPRRSSPSTAPRPAARSCCPPAATRRRSPTTLPPRPCRPRSRRGAASTRASPSPARPAARTPSPSRPRVPT